MNRFDHNIVDDSFSRGDAKLFSAALDFSIGPSCFEQRDEGGTDHGGGIKPELTMRVLARAGAMVIVAALNILFIGDIVGEPGRRAVRELLPKLRERLAVDMCIANGENSAGGSGITQSTAAEIFSAGVDIITSGDHVWDQKEVYALMENESRFLRPVNYPPNTPGQGSTFFQRDGKPSVAVINIQGRTFMPDLENPFWVIQREVNRIRETTPIIFIDMHAEATSEKIALGRMVDGQVSAVVGTHTHVQTADEQIFPGGTAYLSDAGFTGPHESVLGRDIDAIIKRFVTNQPQRFGVATGKILLQGALISVDERTGHATAIQRVSEPLGQSVSNGADRFSRDH